MSGEKRSPEFLLKVTFTILVLWTWNWIKVGGTCPFQLWFNLKEIQVITKKKFCLLFGTFFTNHKELKVKMTSWWWNKKMVILNWGWLFLEVGIGDFNCQSLILKTPIPNSKSQIDQFSPIGDKITNWWFGIGNWQFMDWWLMI